MVNNIYFITGIPKAGKTTLIQNIIYSLKAKLKKLKIGGFISPEIKEHGKRTGFKVVNIDNGFTRTLSSIDGDGPKVGKHHVNIKGFESVAIPALKKFLQYDVFIIDELGAMELKSNLFLNKTEEIFSSISASKSQSNFPLIIASVSDQYLDKFEAYGEVFLVNQSNREELFFELSRIIDNYLLQKQSENSINKENETVSKEKLEKPKHVLDNPTQNITPNHENKSSDREPKKIHSAEQNRKTFAEEVAENHAIRKKGILETILEYIGI